MSPPDFPLTDKQKKYFWVLARKCCPSAVGPNEWKEQIVHHYTGGRTTSLREMDQNELSAFSGAEFWKEVYRPPSREKRRAQGEINMRWKIGYTLQEKGYIPSLLCRDELWDAADAILQRRFKVSINKAKYDELRKILGVIQKRW